MESKRIQMPHDHVTYRIIGCAMAVHRQLGRGHRERIYQRALAVRLTEERLEHVAQKRVAVYDREREGVLIGYYIPDFVVEDSIVVEIKALHGVDNSHLAQVIAYLKQTGCSVGLLINFGRPSLEFKRILPPKDVTEHRVNRQWLYVPKWLK
jgi:GxxExxY protein